MAFSRPRPSMRIDLPPTPRLDVALNRNNAVTIHGTPPTCPETLIQQLLSTFGPILSVSRSSNADGQAQIVVVFSSPAHAEQAASSLDGNTIFGSPLSVTLGHVSTNTHTNNVPATSEDRFFLKHALSNQQQQPDTLAKKNLYICNIPHDCTETELLGAFSQFGAVDHVCVLATSDNMGRRRAFIDMRSGAAARTAAANLHGTQVRGYYIDISFAHVQRSSTNPEGISPLFSPVKTPSFKPSSSYFPPTSTVPAVAPRAAAQSSGSSPLQQQLFSSTSTIASQPPPPYDQTETVVSTRTAETSPSRLSRTLKVEHISRSAAADSIALSQLFRQYGTLYDCELVRKASDPDNAWGQVAFSLAVNAEQARIELDGRSMGGRNLRVTKMYDNWMVPKPLAKSEAIRREPAATPLHRESTLAPRPSAAIPIRRPDGSPTILPADSASNATTPIAEAPPSKHSMPLPIPKGDGAWPTMSNFGVSSKARPSSSVNQREVLGQLSTNRSRADRGDDSQHQRNNSVDTVQSGVPTFSPTSYGPVKDFVRHESDLSMIDDRLSQLAFSPYSSAI